MRIKPQRSGMLRQPLQRIPGIVGRNGKLVFGCQPVINRHHGAARQVAELAAQHIVRGQAANGEATAMKKQQNRQGLE